MEIMESESAELSGSKQVQNEYKYGLKIDFRSCYSNNGVRVSTDGISRNYIFDGILELVREYKDSIEFVGEIPKVKLDECDFIRGYCAKFLVSNLDIVKKVNKDLNSIIIAATACSDPKPVIKIEKLNKD
jgi:hypothetical protein